MFHFTDTQSVTTKIKFGNACFMINIFILATRDGCILHVFCSQIAFLYTSICSRAYFLLHNIVNFYLIILCDDLHGVMIKERSHEF